jgi:hypothetical protein
MDSESGRKRLFQNGKKPETALLRFPAFPENVGRPTISCSGHLAFRF